MIHDKMSMCCDPETIQYKAFKNTLVLISETKILIPCSYNHTY